MHRETTGAVEHVVTVEREPVAVEAAWHRDWRRQASSEIHPADLRAGLGEDLAARVLRDVEDVELATGRVVHRDPRRERTGRDIQRVDARATAGSVVDENRRGATRRRSMPDRLFESVARVD